MAHNERITDFRGNLFSRGHSLVQILFKTRFTSRSLYDRPRYPTLRVCERGRACYLYTLSLYKWFEREGFGGGIVHVL